METGRKPISDTNCSRCKGLERERDCYKRAAEKWWRDHKDLAEATGTSGLTLEQAREKVAGHGSEETQKLTGEALERLQSLREMSGYAERQAKHERLAFCGLPIEEMTKAEVIEACYMLASERDAAFRIHRETLDLMGDINRVERARRAGL